MKPNITISNSLTGVCETREMTDEEFAEWQKAVADFPPMPEATDETPSPT
jgi:hypothetical protein